MATGELAALEAAGRTRVVPTARATRLTMDREGIRRLAAEELGLPTSPYRFVESEAELREAVAALGLPCVVKPVMSSSGKGQSVLRTADDVAPAWSYAVTGGRAAVGGASRAIVEEIAGAVTGALGGWGVFGVELFVRGDEVLFSEVSPRPHDTGLVTLVSQDLSEFALHARAVLGLPIPSVRQLGPAASCAVLAAGHGVPVFHGVDAALERPGTDLRLFGKPSVAGRRRVAVTLALGSDLDDARAAARASAAALWVELV